MTTTRKPRRPNPWTRPLDPADRPVNALAVARAAFPRLAP